MKKHIIILAAFFAAALLVSGCYPEDTPGIKNSGLTITLSSGELETKADGDNPFAFENVIDHFDFYFFKDAAGNQPIRGMHGRVTSDAPAATLSTTLDTSEDGQYSALRKGTSYVYILANYPGAHPEPANMTLDELLALPIESPIVVEKVQERNPVTSEMEENGQVKYCQYLVMDSYQKGTDTTPDTYTTALTPAAIEEEREVTIMLSRLTSKLAMVINVATEVEGTMTYQEGGVTKKEKWTPLLHDLRTYYVNALNNKTAVNGKPIERDTIVVDPASYEYLTYPTKYHLTADGSNDHKFTTDPFYTYPQVWKDAAYGEPYFKIQIPWSSNLRGTSTFYYKVSVPAATDQFRTLNRNTFYTVTIDLSVVDTENDYVELTANYIVSPWLPSHGIGKYDPGVARFFNVPVTEFEVYSQESVTIPFYSSSAVSAYFEKIQYTHYGDKSRPTYTFLYGEGSSTPITLPTRDSNGNTVANAAKDTNPYDLTIEGNSVKFTHALTNVFTERTIWITIKNLDNKETTVVIRQHPAIEVKASPSTTAFVNGHFARASENVHVNGSSQKIGVGYNVYWLPNAGSTQYHSDDNAISNYWYHPGTRPSDESSSARVQKNSAKGIYGAVEGDWSFSMNGDYPNLIFVSVSAFNQNNNTYTIKENGAMQDPKYYRIGDPRMSAGHLFDDLKPYLYRPSTLREPASNGPAVYKDWEDPEKILIANTNKDNGSIIAPRFVVSSFYNAMPGSSACTYEETRKRAATYQEAGYPAGRWRLPTEAEIMYLFARQLEGTIPTLWGGGTKYWCADGRYVQIVNGVPTFFPNDGAGHFNRFIYDIWYWGETPMSDTETYWPNMHEH